jgi:hypothetical protein
MSLFHLLDNLRRGSSRKNRVACLSLILLFPGGIRISLCAVLGRARGSNGCLCI